MSQNFHENNFRMVNRKRKYFDNEKKANYGIWNGQLEGKNSRRMLNNTHEATYK